MRKISKKLVLAEFRILGFNIDELSQVRIRAPSSTINRPLSPPLPGGKARSLPFNGHLAIPLLLAPVTLSPPMGNVSHLRPWRSSSRPAPQCAALQHLSGGHLFQVFLESKTTDLNLESESLQPRCQRMRPWVWSVDAHPAPVVRKCL